MLRTGVRCTLHRRRCDGRPARRLHPRAARRGAARDLRPLPQLRSDLTLAYPAVRGLILLALLALVGIVAASRIVERSDMAASPGPCHDRGWLARLPGLLAWFVLMLSLVRGGLQVLAFNDPGMPIDPELAPAILTTGSVGEWLDRPDRRRVHAAGYLLVAAALASSAAAGGGALHCGAAGDGGRDGPRCRGALASPRARPPGALRHLLAAGLWLGTLASSPWR